MDDLSKMKSNLPTTDKTLPKSPPAQQQLASRASQKAHSSADDSSASSPVPKAKDSSAAVTTRKDSVPPYTAAEKDWLKHKSGWGDEFHFLRDHGLSIYKEEDREEGRELVRAFMEDEGLASRRGEGDEDDDEDDDEDELDASGHQADYAFSQAELAFIKKHYGNSEQFLIIHGLKFYNPEDVEEGVAIAKAFMTEED